MIYYIHFLFKIWCYFWKFHYRKLFFLLTPTFPQISPCSTDPPAPSFNSWLSFLTPLFSPLSLPQNPTFSLLCPAFCRSHLGIPQSTHPLQAWQCVAPPERLSLFPSHIASPMISARSDSHQRSSDWCWKCSRGKTRNSARYSQERELLYISVPASSSSLSVIK